VRSSRRSPLQVARELMLPRGERKAARAERQAEAQIRRERDDPHVAQRIAARNAAEARRQSNQPWGSSARPVSSAGGECYAARPPGHDRHAGQRSVHHQPCGDA
jgi:hypothetical protein